MRRLLGLSSEMGRATARLLLVALSVSTLGPVLHGVHDTECDPTFVVHDEREHHYQLSSSSPSTTPPGEHCVACHFARTTRGAVSWVPAGLHALPSGVRLLQVDGQLVPSVAATPKPARAPPLV
jgi:hypothetical protein